MYRKATLNDCRAVYHMICDLEAKTLPYKEFQNIFRKQLEDSRYECIICEEDEHIIGVLNLRYEEQLHHAGVVAEILEFIIATDYRSNGRGKEMLAYALQRAKDNKCMQLEVACNQLRDNAHRFYLREGLKNSHFKFSKCFQAGK